MSEAINQKMYGKRIKTDKENVPVNENVPIIECNELEELTDDQIANFVDSYEHKISVNDKVESLFSNCVLKIIHSTLIFTNKTFKNFKGYVYFILYTVIIQLLLFTN